MNLTQHNDVQGSEKKQVTKGKIILILIERKFHNCGRSKSKYSARRLIGLLWAYIKVMPLTE